MYLVGAASRANRSVRLRGTSPPDPACFWRVFSPLVFAVLVSTRQLNRLTQGFKMRVNLSCGRESRWWCPPAPVPAPVPAPAPVPGRGAAARPLTEFCLPLRSWWLWVIRDRAERKAIVLAGIVSRVLCARYTATEICGWGKFLQPSLGAFVNFFLASRGRNSS